ncbi:MAG TPA: DNA-processing protein DprA [Usitatibacter sp.]|nr:DNA-processing protein DprA [Usitatibacter sp.]
MDSNPLSREETLAWLNLTLVPGVPARAQRAMLQAFGSALAIARAPQAALAAHLAAPALEAYGRGPAAALVDRTLAWLEPPGRHLVGMTDARYPAPLLQIADPPPVLYAQGRIELVACPSFAIVGSRNATALGAEDAERFARALSDAGLVIASGLALGIDAAAHRGGLAGASSSIAVLGTGADIFYPRRNRELAGELAARGCLLSELPLGTPPDRLNFPRRNRLISGLARGVLVVEAALGSGSLITAREALDQGRDVFAVPGSIHATLSKGCHWLIKEGAKLVECADDILSELGLASVPAPPEAAHAIGARGDSLLAVLGFSPQSIDELVQRTGLEAATLAARLTRLQIEGTVQSIPGARFQRVK